MDKETPYTSTSTLKDDMRVHTTYPDRTGTATTDVSEALGGLGKYPSPGEMLAACVASCMTSMIAHTAKAKGFSCEGLAIHAKVVEHLRGIASLTFHIKVPVPTTPEARRYMETAVNTCPVGRSISADIPKEISWEWAEDEGK